MLGLCDPTLVYRYYYCWKKAINRIQNYWLVKSYSATKLGFPQITISLTTTWCVRIWPNHHHLAKKALWANYCPPTSWTQGYVHRHYVTIIHPGPRWRGYDRAMIDGMRGGEVLIADDPIAFGFTKSKGRGPSQRLWGSCPHSLEDLDGVSPSPLPGPEPSNKQKQQRSFNCITIIQWPLVCNIANPPQTWGKTLCRNAHAALRRQTLAQWFP